ncbi:MAG TPA: protein kinase [Thermoanaerobaculia bacterium]|nr:protein kinase [Thermoanaerobaculia bacterium]
MQLSPANRLGPFEIVAPIGAGGMGEVYRAKDTRLDRQVAIKVLSREFASNASVRERFEREARAVSQLTHPHICTLFDVGQHEGMDFLVMEYLEGETLAKRLERGPLSLDEVFEYSTQIAEALEKAHRQGIIHRDLKPGNVMLTRAGAKLLDFGLAKLTVKGYQALGGLTTLPTEQRNLTQEGTILGTFQYMAPEQLEGAEADARTDIFAFGAVLYEMTTGRKAFEGKNRTSLIAAIVDRDPPPISTLQPLTPPALEHLIRKCLEKDPDRRWQSAADIASQLRWISDSGSQAGVAAPVVVRRKHREIAAWTLAIVAAVATAAFAALWWRASRQPNARVEAAITPPADHQFSHGGLGEGFALSPDGTRIVFTARGRDGMSRLWLRPLRTSTAQPLNGTEEARSPFWSPDNRYIGFFAGGKLKKIDITGGPPQTICDASGAGGFRGGSWSRNNIIVFTPTARDPLFKVSANGGTPAAVTKLDGASGNFTHRFPRFLPDGEHFVFLSRSGSNVGEILLGSLEKGVIKKLVAADSAPFYVEPGYLLYVRDRILLAHRFDADSHELVDDSFPLAENIQYFPSAAYALVAAADEGVIAFQQGSGQSLTQFTWVDRNGKEIETFGEPRDHRAMRLSHDGRRLAVTIRDPQNGNDDIWIYDLVRRGAATRLTFDPLADDLPVWSADDQEVIYSSERSNRAIRDIYSKKSSGEGSPVLVHGSPSLKWPHSVSRDGKWLSFDEVDLKGKNIRDVLVLSRADGKVIPVSATPFDEHGGRLSPDGKWIVYVSGESGKNEVYVQRFPPTGGGKWQISIGGGFAPMWRDDGKEIFYRGLDGKMFGVAVSAGVSFEAATPESLFETRTAGPTTWAPYGDGQRFLLNRPLREQDPSPITLIVNWAEGLRK